METPNTAGFYKLEDNSELLYGPNFVIGPGFELRAETHSDNEYPVHDWYWFDSKEAAREFFNLGPEPEPAPEPTYSHPLAQMAQLRQP